MPPTSTNDLLKRNSRSFYLTLRVLPRAIRHQIGLAYLLARTTDTIADTEIVSPGQRLEALDQLRERIVGLSTDRLNFAELRHLAPSPLGAQVTVTTRVIGTSGRFVDFQIEARDAHELIARGVHKRAIVRTGSFTKRVQVKAS